MTEKGPTKAEKDVLINYSPKRRRKVAVGIIMTEKQQAVAPNRGWGCLPPPPPQDSQNNKCFWFYWFNVEYVRAYEAVIRTFSAWLDFNRGCWHGTFGMMADKMLVETEAMTETLAPETETRPRRLPTCPRRDRDETFDRSRDRDVETETTSLPYGIHWKNSTNQNPGRSTVKEDGTEIALEGKTELIKFLG